MSVEENDFICTKLLQECYNLCEKWDDQMKLLIRSKFADCNITQCRISRKQYEEWNSYNCEKIQLRKFISGHKCNFVLCQSIDTLHEIIFYRNQQFKTLYDVYFHLDILESEFETDDLQNIVELFDAFLPQIELWSDWKGRLDIFDDKDYQSPATTLDSYIKCWNCQMWIETAYNDCVWCKKQRFVTLDAAIHNKEKTKKIESMVQIARNFFSDALQNSPAPTSQASYHQVRNDLKQKIPDFEQVWKENDVYVYKDKYSIKYRDMKSLEGTAWLTDQMISFFMYYWSIYSQTIYAKYRTNYNKNSRIVTIDSLSHYRFNNRHYPNWAEELYDRHLGFATTKKKFFNDYDKILIPCNPSGSHWFLGCINIQQQNISFYDSLSLGNHQQQYNDFFNQVVLYAWNKEKPVGMKEPTHKDWPLINYEVPEQRDGGSCGVFAILYMSYLCIGEEIKSETFRQDDIDLVRSWMIRVIYEEGKNNNTFGIFVKKTDLSKIKMKENKNGVIELPSDSD